MTSAREVSLVALEQSLSVVKVEMRQEHAIHVLGRNSGLCHRLARAAE
jgi:hypothetical protein